jgi:hypothetical protein
MRNCGRKLDLPRQAPDGNNRLDQLSNDPWFWLLFDVVHRHTVEHCGVFEGLQKAYQAAL